MQCRAAVIGIWSELLGFPKQLLGARKMNFRFEEFFANLDEVFNTDEYWTSVSALPKPANLACYTPHSVQHAVELSSNILGSVKALLLATPQRPSDEACYFLCSYSESVEFDTFCRSVLQLSAKEHVARILIHLERSNWTTRALQMSMQHFAPAGTIHSKQNGCRQREECYFIDDYYTICWKSD